MVGNVFDAPDAPPASKDVAPSTATLAAASSDMNRFTL
jgi:hypothetical protein